jgi:hypothetical protein
MFNSVESPKINMSLFSDETLSILNQIFKNDGSLYKSKPKKASGDAKYVWRMLAFYMSKNRQHQCMPVTADFDLETYDENGKWSANLAHKKAKELDKIVDSVLKTIKSSDLPGLNRWKKAFGC